MGDILKYAIENLLHRKMRSWLTVLSILIGIMAIFALVSFGVGVQNYMDSVFEQIGGDKLTIQAGGFTPVGASSISFDDSDVKAIESVNDIDVVAPMYATQVEVKYDPKKKGKWVYVMGNPTDTRQKLLLEEMWDVDVTGRNLEPNDKYKAVLGYRFTKDNDIFEKGLTLRDKIYIDGIPFKIVGFFSEVGNPQDDSNVYIPISTAHELFNDNTYQFIFAKVVKNKDPNDVVPKVEKALRKSRNLDKGKEDFTVQTFEEAVAVFTNIINVLNGVLILIALISVIVSAVNIANSMFTSVLERTNEIGVMKAIGAKNTAIQIIFLIESGLLGLVGGAIGMFLGYLIATTGGKIAQNAGYAMLQPAFPWWLVVGSLTFSFLVGMLSGYFPARQASRLKPVDALRYE